MMTTTYLSKYIQTKADKLDPNKLIGGKATQLRNIDSTLVPYWVAITSDCPDTELSEVVEQAYGNLYWQKPTASGLGDTFAVRSSALNEDGEEQSYAGVFESKLNVPITGLEHAVREVRLSGLADRVSAYGSSLAITIPAVVIMPMVDAKYSGVLFTKEPVGGTNQMLVEYEHGVGGVVDGTSNTEMLFLNREEFNTGTGSIEIYMMPIRIIWKEAKRLENNYRKPLDIEWAIDKHGVPYILQVRPITAGVGV